MHINIIEGEHNDRSLSMCYNYLMEKYIREKVNKTDGESSDNRDICESEYRGAS
jgi:hypothetical protein